MFLFADHGRKSHTYADMSLASGPWAFTGRIMANSEVIDLDALPDDTAPKNNLREAEEKKEVGNEFYKIKDYKNALQHYSAAINLCPEKAAYYGNRSACYVMLGQYKQALEDAKRSVALDSSFTKGYVRAAKCLLALGDLVGLQQALLQMEALDIKENMSTEITASQKVQELQNNAQNSYDKKDFRKVVYLMDRCLELCPASDRFKLIKSECLALLGRCDEAQEIAFDIIGRDNSNADAIFVRGMCLYYQDNEQAGKHFQHVLKLAPDHQKAMEFYKKAKLLKQKKEEGNEAFKVGKLQEAYNLYTEALNIDPLNKLVNTKLFSNKATVCSKLKKLEEAVENCTKALEIDPNYLKALMRRAKCYTDLGKHDEAVRDYENLFKLDKSQTNRHLLNEAKLALKKSKRKDYYKILGIEKNATDDEIKKAYRKRALVLHPDRHVNATEEERREQERCFKELGEAYGVLSDPKKKSRYDYGQDIEEGEMDANSVFRQFFSRGGNSFFDFDCSGMSDGGGVTFQFG